MSTSIHTACPHIVPIFELDTRPEYNKPVPYTCTDGTEYVFCDHTAPDGRITRVQFCKRIGRKQDVFQCLNESEWRLCYAAKDVITS